MPKHRKLASGIGVEAEFALSEPPFASCCTQTVVWERSRTNALLGEDQASGRWAPSTFSPETAEKIFSSKKQLG